MKKVKIENIDLDKKEIKYLHAGGQKQTWVVYRNTKQISTLAKFIEMSNAHKNSFLDITKIYVDYIKENETYKPYNKSWAYDK